MTIRTTLLIVVAVSLTGCAVYPAAPYGTVYEPAPYGAVHEPAPVYVTPAPVFIGGSVYYGNSRGHNSRGYVRPHAPPRPHLHVPRPGPHGHGRGPAQRHQGHRR
jgi:hypothetical protein